MIQDISPLKLNNHYHEPAPADTDIVFIFKGTGRRDDKMVTRLTEDGVVAFPTVAEIIAYYGEEVRPSLRFLFSIEPQNYYLLEQMSPDDLPGSYTYEQFRSVREYRPEYLRFAAVTAYHLFNWNINNQYCGRCGAKTIHDHKERAFRCPSCGNMIFPRIQPAVIVGVIHGNKILTSKYSGRPGSTGRALIAGFVEIGETVEQTVAREVMEEVGLKVKNIRFFANQPWGFDSDLLLGYYCDVDGDDSITLDGDELASAEFVAREDLAPATNLASLTATMIETFRRGENN